VELIRTCMLPNGADPASRGKMMLTAKVRRAQVQNYATAGGPADRLRLTEQAIANIV